MRLFIGNISSNTSKKSFISEFEKFGKCEVEFYRKFAYINYLKDLDAKNALNSWNNQDLNGNKLKIEFSQIRPPGYSSPEASVDSPAEDFEEKSTGGKNSLIVPVVEMKIPPNTPNEEQAEGLEIKEEVLARGSGKARLMKDVLEVEKNETEFKEHKSLAGEEVLVVSLGDEENEISEEAEGNLEIEVEIEAENCEEDMQEIEKNTAEEIENFQEEVCKKEEETKKMKKDSEEFAIQIGDKEIEEAKNIEKFEVFGGEDRPVQDIIYSSKETQKTENKKQEEAKIKHKGSPFDNMILPKFYIPIIDPFVAKQPEPEKEKPSLLLEIAKKSSEKSDKSRKVTTEETQNDISLSENIQKTAKRLDVDFSPSPQKEKLPTKKKKITETPSGPSKSKAKSLTDLEKKTQTKKSQNPAKEETVLISQTEFKIKKKLKDFPNSQVVCCKCGKQLKVKSVSSHINSKFHKDSS